MDAKGCDLMMTQLNRWIKQHTGINITPDKQVIIATAVNELARKNRVSAALYIRLILTGDTDKNQFIDAITTPESFFLRHKQTMAFVIDNIIRKIVAENGVARILCLPCARGEEPYSLAMMLMDRGIGLNRVYITGIDISKKWINHAKKGVYNSYSLRQVPHDFKQRHFISAPNYHLKVSPAVLGKINFYPVNLFEFPSSMIPAGFDVIFCQNLFIYFDKPTINMALTVLDSILSPRGWLFVDITEVPNICLPFKRVEAGGSFGFRKAGTMQVKPKKNVPAASGYKTKKTMPQTSVKTAKKITFPQEPVTAPASGNGAGMTLQKARAAYSTKDCYLARELFTELLSHEAYRAKAYLGLAIICSDRGENLEALDHAETALKLITDGHVERTLNLIPDSKGLDKSEQIEIHAILAVILYRKGIVEHAMLHFKALKKMAPNHEALKLVKNFK